MERTPQEMPLQLTPNPLKNLVFLKEVFQLGVSISSLVRDNCAQKSNRTFSPANRTFDRKKPPLYNESTKEALIMKQTIYEEMGGSYSMVGEYRLPDLAVSEAELNIGPWGQRHLRYLRQRRRISYVNLMTTGRLPAYLAELNRQAQEMFTLLTEQYAAAEGVTEQLKAENQLEWVRRMNSIRDRVTEVIHRDLIYT